LHTYKKTPDAQTLSYDLHFWLGEETSQDEAATAAYKTVELDDHLKGAPVQYREVQGHESTRFLSYFPSFTCLKGGVASGFHHVSQVPPPTIIKLYHIVSPSSSSAHAKHFIIREVSPNPQSIRYGDVFVLDKGIEVLQFNMKGSSGKERFKAAEFVRSVADSRAKCPVHVYEQGAPGAGSFLAAIGATTDSLPASPPPEPDNAAKLHRLSDSNGNVQFTEVPPPFSQATLSSSEVFILEASSPVAVFVWIGRAADVIERKAAFHFGQKYLWEQSSAHKATSLVQVTEGNEPEIFIAALKS